MSALKVINAWQQPFIMVCALFGCTLLPADHDSQCPAIICFRLAHSGDAVNGWLSF
jgi:hypothetical protein